MPLKLVFESETELGRCSGDPLDGYSDSRASEWIVIAHTVAATTSANGMLRIEQRCFLRAADCPQEVRAQTWVRSGMHFEPVHTSQEETLELAGRLHESFVDQARTSLLEQSLLQTGPVPSTVATP